MLYGESGFCAPGGAGLRGCWCLCPNATPSTTAGAEFYKNLGYVTCHGTQGWDSKTGPPVAGMSVKDIKDAVRNAKPPMPSFSLETLGDANLASLASYIATFKPPVLSSALKAHLDEAAEAADAANKDGVILHVGEAIKIAPAELRYSLEFILEAANKGEFEEADHSLHMLMGEAH